MADQWRVTQPLACVVGVTDEELRGATAVLQAAARSCGQWRWLHPQHYAYACMQCLQIQAPPRLRILHQKQEDGSYSLNCGMARKHRRVSEARRDRGGKPRGVLDDTNKEAEPRGSPNDTKKEVVPSVFMNDKLLRVEHFAARCAGSPCVPIPLVGYVLTQANGIR